MKTNRLLALLLALLMVGSIAIAETADDPAVVVVDGEAVPLSVVQSVFDAAYEENAVLYAQNGVAMTQEDLDGALTELLEQYVQMLIIEKKIEELGFDQVTDADKEKFRADIETSFAEELAGYAAYYGVTVDEAREAYEMNGWTPDTIYETNLPYLPQARLQDYTAEGVSVSDEEARKMYDEEYVPEDKALYENDVASFESTVFFYGRNSVFYVPNGYRNVKHIKLQIPEDVAAQINDLNADLSAARNAVNALNSELYLLENTPAEGAETAESEAPARTETEIQADLDAQQQNLDSLESKLSEVYEQVLPSLQPTVDEITAKLSSGTSFDALIDEYSTDEEAGSESELIHKESTFVDVARREAAMVLSNPGDVSEPVVAEDGVYILQYVSDAGGPVELTPEILGLIRDSLAMDRKEKAFAEAYQGWVAEATIEKHPELVVLPQLDATATEVEESAPEGEPEGDVETNEDGSIG